MKRSGKFYRKNEAEVMRMLGIEPTPNSGSGWIVKEDGQNDNVICQLKSTDANSMTIKLNDIQTLEYNAIVSHKIPVFAVQFFSCDEIWLMVRPQDVKDIGKYIKTGVYNSEENMLTNVRESGTIKKVKSVKSSEIARKEFHDGRKKKYSKERSAW